MSDEYPEHEKLRKVSELSQGIGDFLEWLSDDQHVWLAKFDVKVDECRNCGHADAHNERVTPSAYYGQRVCSFENEETSECCTCDDADFGNTNRLYTWPFATNKLLAEYFGINLNVLEIEKRAMLDTMRAQNATPR